jgi:hypothetical protein
MPRSVLVESVEDDVVEVVDVRVVTLSSDDPSVDVLMPPGQLRITDNDSENICIANQDVADCMFCGVGVRGGW